MLMPLMNRPGAGWWWAGLPWVLPRYERLARSRPRR